MDTPDIFCEEMPCDKKGKQCRHKYFKIGTLSLGGCTSQDHGNQGQIVCSGNKEELSMTLDQLRVLTAIVETGSFRGAADKLHRAQSAISYAIKTLEDEFDLKVFNRSSYRPELTKEGRLLYHKAISLIDQSQEFERLGRYLSSGLETELRLALSFICPIEPVTQVLRRFSQKFPMTALNLSVTNMQEPIERLLKDDADIAISDVHGWQDSLETIFWKKITLVPVCAIGYPLLTDTNGVSAFTRYTQVIVSTTPRPEDGVSAGIISGSRQWVVTTFSAKMEILKAGLGWGFMPEHLVKNELLQKNLVSITHLKPLASEFYICRNKGRPLGEASRFIWNQLINSTVEE